MSVSALNAFLRSAGTQLAAWIIPAKSMIWQRFGSDYWRIPRHRPCSTLTPDARIAPPQCAIGTPAAREFPDLSRNRAQAHQPPGRWRNRILGQAEVDPSTLVANPANWRAHPKEQQAGLSAALADVGWVGTVMVNRTTGHIVDGHARVELALANHEPAVPVLYVEAHRGRGAGRPRDLRSARCHGDEPDRGAGGAARLARAGRRRSRRPARRHRRAQRHPAGLARRPRVIPEIPADAELYVKAGDLWTLGDHRLLCGDATDPAAVARLLGTDQPTLLVTDPPYGVSLDPRWRDTTYNRFGPAEQPYMRIEGHRNTTMSGDTRADWSGGLRAGPEPERRLRLARRRPRRGGRRRPAPDRLRDRLAGHLGQGDLRDGSLRDHWGHEPCWVSASPASRTCSTASATSPRSGGCPAPR